MTRSLVYICLGKGKLRSPVGGTIYANVIWPAIKWKYATVIFTIWFTSDFRQTRKLPSMTSLVVQD